MQCSKYIRKVMMQVGKWGNSRAVRLPASVVEALGLSDGDEIEIAGKRSFEVSRAQSREDILKELQALELRLPPGYKFKRSHAYED